MTLEQCFMGLADRTRLRILNLLLRGELCGCDIQYVLGVSQSGVSRHLTYLKRAGFVVDRRDGYRVFYQLVTPAGANSLLVAYLQEAFGEDKEFGADLKALNVAVRKGACSLSEAKGRPHRAQRAPARARRATV